MDDAPTTKIYIDLFNQIWSDSEKLEDVTEELCDPIAKSVYQENSPEHLFPDALQCTEFSGRYQRRCICRMTVPVIRTA